jgi:hypothetical protein
MSRLNPEGYRKAAERCREQALSHENPNEWVRFSLTWESIAAMSERLQASISLDALRPSGSVAATR